MSTRQVVMSARRSFLTTRVLLTALAGITLLLAVALVSLAWLVLQQDSVLAQERVRTHLESAADKVVAALDERVSDVETMLANAFILPRPERFGALRQLGSHPAEGIAIVDVDAHDVHVFPATAVLYVPIEAVPDVGVNESLRRGEALEFSSGDFAGANSIYAKEALSTDRRTRAEALLRLGRVLRKRGELDGALHAFTRLLLLDSVLVADSRAGLIGGVASVDVLVRLGRHTQARRLRDSLRVRLNRADWIVSRGSFEHYNMILGGSTDAEVAGPAPHRALLSRALDTLSYERRVAGSEIRTTKRNVLVNGAAVVTISMARNDRWLVFAATERYVGALIDGLEATTLSEQGVWIELRDPTGVVAHSRLPTGSKPGLMRLSAETGLPWTIAFAIRDPASITQEFQRRRMLLLAGLLIAMLLGIVGTYVVLRAIGRELAVARLHSDFVTAVSHELRTPLTSLRHLADSMATGRVQGESRRALYLDLLREETTRLHRLVETLLDFGRMEAGAREYRLEPLDISELVRDVGQTFATGVGPRAGPIAIDAPDPGYRVRGDREALGVALWNLLDNATKYASTMHGIHVRVTRTVDKVRLSVRDFGPGIPASEQINVFDKFVRGHAARSSGIRGTGLGLALVTQVARAHGGVARVESVQGEGSTFLIELPHVTQS